MLNEGFKASSPGLMIADVRYKGGMYVELTQTNQHVEYIYVNTIATENYEAFCGMAYDVKARNDTSTELEITEGGCTAIPGKQVNALLTLLPLLFMLSLPDALCTNIQTAAGMDNYSPPPFEAGACHQCMLTFMVVHISLEQI